MFTISGLPLAGFAPYFSMTDAELAAHSARRVVADSKPGFPCRVSLADAEIGESLILVNYTHQDSSSPYRASHAIYIRENATEYQPQPGEVPPVLASRVLSLRAFDANGDMRDARVCDGREAADVIDNLLSLPEVVAVDVHNAAPGCFAARAVRA